MILSPKLAAFMVMAASAFAAEPAETYLPCSEDTAKHELRARELLKIHDEDQADRPNNQMKPGAQFRDRKRRQRVGEIFGEGCIKTPADYAAAAMVFQHGDQPEQFFQTFMWSKRAVELGEPKQKGLMAMGLDRYLVNSGQKQLFASQATKPLKGCWCLQAVEPTFPEAMRVEYTGRTIEKMVEWVATLNAGTTCPPAGQCDSPLKPSPQGTVPGFW